MSRCIWTITFVSALGCRFDPGTAGGTGGLGSEGGSAASTGAGGLDTSDGGGSTAAGVSGGQDTGSVDESSSGVAVDGSGDGGSSGPTDPCAVANGGCDPDAICSVADGTVACACPEGFDGDGSVCEPVPALAPLRTELPCDFAIAGGCATDAQDTVSATMIGPAGVQFLVTVHVRGAVELMDYDGGAPDGAWNPGGSVPLLDGKTVATLRVSDPEQTIRINHGPESLDVVAIDETHAFVVTVGATVELDLVAGGIGIIDNNADVVVAGVPPDPDPFDGQFMDVQFTQLTPM